VNVILAPSRATRRHASSTPELVRRAAKDVRVIEGVERSVPEGQRRSVRCDDLASPSHAVRHGAFARNAQGRERDVHHDQLAA
jgi:hypothetical protein